MSISALRLTAFHVFLQSCSAELQPVRHLGMKSVTQIHKNSCCCSTQRSFDSSASQSRTSIWSSLPLTPYYCAILGTGLPVVFQIWQSAIRTHFNTDGPRVWEWKRKQRLNSPLELILLTTISVTFHVYKWIQHNDCFQDRLWKCTLSSP